MNCRCPTGLSLCAVTPRTARPGSEASAFGFRGWQRWQKKQVRAFGSDLYFFSVQQPINARVHSGRFAEKRTEAGPSLIPKISDPVADGFRQGSADAVGDVAQAAESRHRSSSAHRELTRVRYDG